MEPQADANVGVRLTDCTGVKEKITDEEWTTTVATASAGPATVVVVSQSYTRTDMGYQWQFECTIKVTEMSGECWGDVNRKCNWYAQVEGQDEAEASCAYTGLKSPISDSGCTTGQTHEGSYLVRLDGKTWGYPQDGEGCAIAEVVNEPQNNVRAPFVGDVFPTVSDTINTCDQDAISWDSADEHIVKVGGHLLGSI